MRPDSLLPSCEDFHPRAAAAEEMDGRPPGSGWEVLSFCVLAREKPVTYPRILPSTGNQATGHLPGVPSRSASYPDQMAN